jgi:hypothetical protein
LSTFGHLSPKVGRDGYHKQGVPIVVSFSVRPCAGLGASHTLFGVALPTVILLIEKWAERSGNLSK